MKRIDNLNLSKLISAVKDIEGIISLLETTFPELKYLWFNYKGNKVIPLFSLTDILNVDKHTPYIGTQVIDNYLLHTGVLCVRTEDDINDISLHNPYHNNLPKIKSLLNKKSISFVRLFPPVSTLLILLSGQTSNCKKLQKELGIVIPSNMGITALLGSINRALVRSDISRSNFFQYKSDTLPLLTHNDIKEKRSNTKRLKQNDNPLSQPSVKSVTKTQTTTTDALMVMREYLKELTANLTISEMMINDNKEKIESLQSAIVEQQKDYSRLQELITAMETSISVISKSNNN